MRGGEGANVSEQLLHGRHVRTLYHLILSPVLNFTKTEARPQEVVWMGKFTSPILSPEMEAKLAIPISALPHISSSRCRDVVSKSPLRFHLLQHSLAFPLTWFTPT